MCDLTLTEKRKEIQIMFSENALSLLNKEEGINNSNDEAVALIKKWYNSKEKQTRLLRDWQGMRLSTAMYADPSTSEMGLYRSFIAKMMSTQKN